MVGTAQPLCLLRQEPKASLRHHDESAGKGKPQSLVTLLGLDGNTLSSRRRSIFLDIPFYRTAFAEAPVEDRRSALRNFLEQDFVARNNFRLARIQGKRPNLTVFTQCGVDGDDGLAWALWFVSTKGNRGHIRSDG